MTDSELLGRYAGQGDEAAFADVVRRHADLVYSAALRVTNNSQLAQDAAQAVFIKLARHASMLAGYDTIVGWLHTTTRHAAINTVRAESRRHAREQEASTMHDNAADQEMNWEQLRPVLDEAVDKLRETDRKAVLLRFFKGLSHQEVGDVLGMSEDTARKRVERALEKLRTYFTRRGLTVSSTLLAAAVSENSVQAAPIGFADKVAATSLIGTVGGGFAGLLLFMSTKTKAIFAALVLAALVVFLGVHFALSPNVNQQLPSIAQLPTSPKPSPKETPPVVALAPIAPPAETATALRPPFPQSLPGVPASNLQADLNSMIPEIVQLIQSNNYTTLLSKYTPPSVIKPLLRNIPPQNQDQFLRMFVQQMTNTSGFKEFFNQYATVLESIKTDPPVYDGDMALFKAPLSPDGKPGEGTVNFVKEDGLWYFDIQMKLEPGSKPGTKEAVFLFNERQKPAATAQ